MTPSQYVAYQTKMADAYAGGFEYEAALGGRGTMSVNENAQLSKGTYYLVVRPSKGLPMQGVAEVSQVKLTLVAEW
jgi:hypothetical protein